jgi:hypothetical protein
LRPATARGLWFLESLCCLHRGEANAGNGPGVHVTKFVTCVPTARSAMAICTMVR